MGDKKKMIQFKNKHSGETVVLVGNGPSLAKTNLDIINVPSIAMNRINLIFPKTTWRPTYYLFASNNIYHHLWGKEWKQSVKAIIGRSITTFLSEDYKDEFPKEENVHYFKARDFVDIWKRKMAIRKLYEIANLYAQSIAVPPIKMPDKVFSKDPKNYLSKFSTSMLIAYQLAYYMDFSKIILVGCDVNWKRSVNDKGNDPNHFSKDYGASLPHGNLDSELVFLGHGIAKKEFDKKGVEIVNCSVETELDMFRRSNLEGELSG